MKELDYLEKGNDFTIAEILRKKSLNVHYNGAGGQASSVILNAENLLIHEACVEK